MAAKRFVVLDRDGTLIEERHYLSDPEGVALTPRAGAGLRKLKELGFGIVVATNQSGIGRGFFDHARLNEIHSRLADLLENEGVRLEGIYVCPHTPDDDCACRKPKLGLMTQAMRDHAFSPQESFVIGDKDVDIELGKNAGATTFLVRTGYGAELERAGTALPHFVADDILHAAEMIERMVRKPHKEHVPTHGPND